MGIPNSMRNINKLMLKFGNYHIISNIIIIILLLNRQISKYAHFAQIHIAPAKVHLIYHPGYVIYRGGKLAKEKNTVNIPEFLTGVFITEVC
jgi:hypothetical protein